MVCSVQPHTTQADFYGSFRSCFPLPASVPGPVLNVCDNKSFPPVQSIIHYSRSEIRLFVVPCVQPQAFTLFVHHVLPFSFPPRMKNHQAFMHCRKFVHCVPVQNTASICERIQERTKIYGSQNCKSFRSFVSFVRYFNELPALAILRALASLTGIFGAFAVFHHYKNKQPRKR